MNSYVLLSEKPWHQKLFAQLSVREGEQWTWIKEKQQFTVKHLEQLKPKQIFVPHWSYIISAETFESFECIVFHMTDLPYGRGGSPLQNLIVRGQTESQISALQVEEGIDTGPVYLKKPLSLHGTGEEIFVRSVPIIGAMIEEIIDKNIRPEPQSGTPTIFKRRKPGQGNLEELSDVSQVYDYIRMLDIEGYPNAFVETAHFRFDFSRASLKAGETIVADVRITKK